MVMEKIPIDAMFCHCARCLGDCPSDTPPKDWAKIQAFIAEGNSKLVIWCNRCDVMIAVFTLDLDGQKEIIHVSPQELN